MRKILFLLCLVSCNSKTNQQTATPNVCIDMIWNYESANKSNQPYVGIKIKIEDSLTFKKIESGKLNNIFLYNLDKRYSQFFKLESFGIGRQFEKAGSFFTFKIQTFIFSGSPNNYLSKWSNENIKKVFDGDIGLIFDKDTMRIHHCDDVIIKKSKNE